MLMGVTPIFIVPFDRELGNQTLGCVECGKMHRYLQILKHFYASQLPTFKWNIWSNISQRQAGLLCMLYKYWKWRKEIVHSITAASTCRWENPSRHCIYINKGLFLWQNKNLPRLETVFGETFRPNRCRACGKFKVLYNQTTYLC
jgi:hypothetical protein